VSWSTVGNLLRALVQAVFAVVRPGAGFPVATAVVAEFAAAAALVARSQYVLFFLVRENNMVEDIPSYDCNRY